MKWVQALGLLVVLTALLVAAPGCSGGNRRDVFALCGNGVIDPGEQCDTGPDLSDDGDCLTTCVLAICGDTFVDLNREQCDLTNLRNQTCKTLMFDGGTLVCSPDCQFDTSGCGPAFTPTPSPTPGATPTPTPRTECGDGVLQPGETCETCPNDCVVQPCDAAPPTLTYTVTFMPPSGQDAGAVQILVGYNSSVLNLPAGSAASTRIRNRPRNTVFSVNNVGYAVNVNVNRGLNPSLPSGTLFTVDFDSCVGSPPPTATDASCIIEGCTDVANQPLTGCSCTITYP